MNDINYILRQAYYQLLNGNLTSSTTGVSNPVIVSDTINPIADINSVYVLLISESGISNNTHQSFMMETRIRVDIIARGNRVATKTVDDIANQVLNLILPTPQTNALGNSKFINCRVVDDRYQPFSADGAVNVARRMITFLQTVAQ